MISDSMNFYIIVQAGVEVLNTLDVSLDGAACQPPQFEECSKPVHVGDLLQELKELPPLWEGGVMFLQSTHQFCTTTQPPSKLLVRSREGQREGEVRGKDREVRDKDFLYY